MDSDTDLMNSLDSNEWLDNSVIDKYANMLNSAFSDTVLNFPTYFYNHFKKHGYEGVKKWGNSENMLDRKYIFFILYENSHIFIAVFETQSSHFYALDPYNEKIENGSCVDKKQRNFEKHRYDKIIDKLKLLHTYFLVEHQKMMKIIDNKATHYSV